MYVHVLHVLHVNMKVHVHCIITYVNLLYSEYINFFGVVKIWRIFTNFLKTPAQYYNEAVLVQLSWAKNLLSTQILALPEILQECYKNTVTIP